jgi:hypothetical protein
VRLVGSEEHGFSRVEVDHVQEEDDKAADVASRVLPVESQQQGLERRLGCCANLQRWQWTVLVWQCHPAEACRWRWGVRRYARVEGRARANGPHGVVQGDGGCQKKQACTATTAHDQSHACPLQWSHRSQVLATQDRGGATG